MPVDSVCPQDHGKVLALLNHLLSSVASAPTSPQSQRARLQQLAVVVAERYKGCGHSAPPPLAHTFFLLLDIMTFFDHYHSKRPDQALEVSCPCDSVCCRGEGCFLSTHSTFTFCCIHNCQLSIYGHYV